MWLILSVIIVALVAVIIAVVLFVFKKGKFIPGSCDQTQQDPTCMWILEKYRDKSLVDPEDQVYLADFSFDPNMGKSICKPIWYSYRWVRSTDGGYSELSPWMVSGIQSGSSDLPCLGGPEGCISRGSNFSGHSSCGFNKVIIGMAEKPAYDISSGIYANIHRQIGKFNPKSEGDIIGYFLPSTSDVRFPMEAIDIQDKSSANGVCPNC